MRRAVCPQCERNVYSADTMSDLWTCPYCEVEFKPEFEESLEAEDKHQQH